MSRPASPAAARAGQDRTAPSNLDPTAANDTQTPHIALPSHADARPHRPSSNRGGLAASRGTYARDLPPHVEPPPFFVLVLAKQGQGNAPRRAPTGGVSVGRIPSRWCAWEWEWKWNSSRRRLRTSGGTRE
jgi:hypothetical protein